MSDTAERKKARLSPPGWGVETWRLLEQPIAAGVEAWRLLRQPIAAAAGSRYQWLRETVAPLGLLFTTRTPSLSCLTREGFPGKWGTQFDICLTKSKKQH